MYSVVAMNALSARLGESTGYVYVIAWFGVVFGINSTSNAEIIVRARVQFTAL